MKINSYRLENVSELNTSGLAAQVLGEITLKTSSSREDCYCSPDMCACTWDCNDDYCSCDTECWGDCYPQCDCQGD